MLFLLLLFLLLLLLLLLMFFLLLHLGLATRWRAADGYLGRGR